MPLLCRLLGACTVCLCVRVGLAALLASSSVEKCVRSGLEESIDETCQEKIFTTITMEGGQTIATEELQYTLECVSDDGICPCECNYELDEGCTCRDIDGSISISITKSPVSLLYPTTYIRNIQYYPTEETIYTDNCKDGPHETVPTCSWLSIGGEIQEDSQGFCCGCTSEDVYDQTFGDGTEYTRAGLNCNWWSQPFIPFFASQPDSAHCMRWNNGWWEAYDIHESHMDFEIIVTVNTTLGSNITQGTSTSTSNHTVSSLTLTPSRPKGVTEDRRVSAHLLGELSSYEAFPVLTSSKLLVRKAPGALHTLTSNDMMVVDNTMITLDGSECNKIGVGFTAFRYHTEKCSRRVATCLDNQPYHLVTEDSDREAMGWEPKYRANRYSQVGVVSLAFNLTGPVEDRWMKIKYPVPAISSSIMTLEVAADSLTFIQNYSPGQILSAKVCNSAMTVCDSVAALNSASRAMIEVKNVGFLSSSYMVTLDNCTYPIIPVAAKSLALTSNETAEVWFELYMASDQEAEQVNCTIDLFDSQGGVTDTAILGFGVNATVREALPDPFPPPAIRTVENFTPPKVATCIDKCGMFNAVCLWWKGCTAEIAKLFGGIAGALIGPAQHGYSSSSGHHHWKRPYRDPPHGAHSSDGHYRDDSDPQDRKRGRSMAGRRDRESAPDRQGRSASRGSRSSASPSRRHKHRSDGGKSSSTRGRKPRSRPSLVEQMTGKHASRKRKHASKSWRARNRSESGTSSDDDSLLSQSESNSDTDGNASHAEGKPATADTGLTITKVKMKKGNESVQQVEKQSAKPSKRRQPEETVENLETEQRKKKQSRSKTRSKTKAMSRDGRRGKGAVAEGFNLQWPAETLTFNVEYGLEETGHVETRESPYYAGLGVTEDAWQQPIAGEQNEVAGPIAGRRHHTGPDAGDDQAGGLNGVFID